MNCSGIALPIALILGTATALAAADGKAVFLEKKCNLCHSIDSQEIARTNPKMKGPDLSNASAMVESAEWLKSFLHREVELNGKKHLREFKGTDEEMNAVVEWLMSLKTS